MATNRDPHDPARTGVSPALAAGAAHPARRRSTWGLGAGLVVLLILLALWLFWPRATPMDPATTAPPPPATGALPPAGTAPAPAPATPAPTTPAPTR